MGDPVGQGLVGRVARWVLRGVAVVGVGAAVVPYVEAAGWWPILQAVAPAVGLVGVVVAVALWFLRNRGFAAAASLACVALLWPVYAPTPRPEPGPGPAVRVVSLNTEFGGADPAAIMAQVRQRRPDVLVLLEATPELWDRLQAAGLARHLPYASGRTSHGAAGTVIATAAPAACVELPRGARCGRVAPRPAGLGGDTLAGMPVAFDTPSVRLADGTLVKALHPWPPAPGSTDKWLMEQHALLAWRRARPAGERLILAGDTNAGSVHPVFRGVADGLTVAPRGGVPWQRTWPRERRVPPFVQIDHILARGYGVRNEGTVLVPGTDHAGVWAELAAS